MLVGFIAQACHVIVDFCLLRARHFDCQSGIVYWLV